MVFQLSFAGIPLLLDQARVVRMNQPSPEQEAPEQLPPRKHQPMADLVDELNRMLPSCYLQDFQLPGDYPGRDLGAIAYRSHIGPQPNPQLRLNDWYYPPTCSRWSVFRGLATSTQVKAMLLATQSAQGTIPAEFIMRSDLLIAQPLTRINDLAVNAFAGAQNPALRYELTTSMYLLPPRPLAEHGLQFDGLYLITLVDERYHFQYSPVSLRVVKGTTWNDLLIQLALALGITVGGFTIDSVYGAPEPDSHLWTTMENASVLLDAVAYNLGRVVVRWLDGTYQLLLPAESQTLAKANRGLATQVLRLAGGEILNSSTLSLAGDKSLAKNLIIPESIKVTFPKYIVGDDPVPHFLNTRYQAPRQSAWFEESFGGDFTVTVPIASANIVPVGNDLVSDASPLGGLTGVPGISHTIHNTSKALYNTETASTGNPLNITELTALAIQLAADYYQSQVDIGLDEVYPGTYDWIPEGFHDIVWTYSARTARASTRVMRTQWNQMVKEMQHGTFPLSPNTGGTGAYNVKGVGGPSVAQTIRDSFVGEDDGVPVITTQLAAGLATADFTAQFNTVAYFPTQNRWRGKINNEILLFEGTSGGLNSSPGLPFSVGIVYRGIDGTLVANHTAGATISQLGPNLAYGVNLTTYEKAQFIYPQEWTSGGIQGANIVPQTQSVLALDGTGGLINQIRHFSGSVLTYDWTKNTGFQWVSQEFIWLVERNNRNPTTGQRYDGQLVGYSNDNPLGKAFPIYAVNIDQAGGGTTCFDAGISIRGQSDPLIVFSLGDCPLTTTLLTTGANGVDSFTFNACNFVTTATEAGRCPGFFAANVKTRGLTIQVTDLDTNCRPLVLSFRDGLLQQTQTL